MSLSLVLIVLTAAFLHAFWNALVKGSGDKTIVLGLIALGHVVPGIAIAALTPIPGWAAVPYIIASTLIHWGYYYFLNLAYRMGDLSLVYPITRGLAPVLVALGAQLWIGETLPVLAWLGIFSVSAGVMILSQGIFKTGLPKISIVAAVIVAAIVAAYSLVDGIGVRLSDSIMGYIGWLFAAEACVALFIFKTRWAQLRMMPVKTCLLGFIGGVLSATAYALVLYVKTEAPLGAVSALRETSVIFAALIGVLWFSEGPKTRRLLAGAIVAAGTILIGLAS
jgi:drug/metabolite transporter (DMT)-like permease